jgi:hypothetical protein
MKRLSRHTVVVLLVFLLTSVGGMSVAVVAFGQSGGDPDATVPLGDYTATTPTTSTQPLSTYTTTVNTTATTPPSTSTGGSTTPQTETSVSTATSGSEPSRTSSGTPSSPGGATPSRATRSGPTHLAFTGGEPLVIGAFGIAAMGAGLVLHRRRRAARSS